MQDSLNQRDFDEKNHTQFLPEYEVTREEKEERKGEKEEVAASPNIVVVVIIRVYNM